MNTCPGTQLLTTKNICLLSLWGRRNSRSTVDIGIL